MINFKSTRHRVSDDSVGLVDALKQGLATDGGLYIPTTMPAFDWDDYSDATSLPEIAERLLAPYVADSELEPFLAEICREALDIIVPNISIGDKASVLELFHGPTAAFKDFGAQFLASCLSRIDGGGRGGVVLVATSGDTGAAVAAAFYNKPGFRVVLLYPDGQVSARQAHTLECWGPSVRALRVAGTFDDCQRMVKMALADRTITSEVNLVSANSINVGRWLPQTAYYALAAINAVRMGHRALRLIVPTGNLGNATAALLLRKAGWPIADIALACNANQVVPDYLSTGDFKARPSVATLANAMDVGAPSNVERLAALSGKIVSDPQLSGRSFDDARIRSVVRSAPSAFGYIPCPHTACALAMLQDLRSKGDDHAWTVCATADPAKFDSIIEPLLELKLPVTVSLRAMLERPTRIEPMAANYDDLAGILLG